MQTSVLSSTAFLTLLLATGLVFFIRASTKDRTQVAELVAPQDEETVLEQLKQYFLQRAYHVTSIEPTEKRVTFEGFVRPSLFLAVFLTLLAATGILCLSLVLSFAFPQFSTPLLGLVLLAPAAGVFYWRTAARPETVLLQLRSLSSPESSTQSLVTVTAHRDELAELQRALELKPLSTAET